ncbi:MAG: tRNA (N(6)-L-threonylcarbamoyladenosine(37)-C(2))-methylthiotransferase MtaB [Candidatus Saelkia tenebricola]|nr:tRNA (N(6)-L-threonylcarbamoyladenosine(37)-C(2))-methylthiotransferase MtaB [Candidatus Saelkia tenebricola]
MNYFYLKTFGCKLNQYESQLIRENLIFNGWIEVFVIQNAEYVFVHSCAVTANSIKELRKFVHSAKRKKQNLKIVVLGCVVEIYPEELKGLFLFKMFSNKEKFKIMDSFSDKHVEFFDRISSFQGHTRSFVKIQDGCDNKCSYCCAWMARGPSKSRDPENILEEVKVLLNNGYKEIVLTGLCLGDFGKDIDHSLVMLLREIESLDFDFRIRLSSIEPQDVGEELITYMKQSQKVVPHVHVSLQSGSDKILKLMGRRYSVDYFKDMIHRLKGINNFQFSTDIIIGFPEENDKDLQNTMNLLKDFSPVRVHIFPFSPRPHTRAYGMGGMTASCIIDQSKKEVFDFIKKLIIKNLKNQIGKTFTVLFEQKTGNYWAGYTENYIRVILKDKEDLKNRFINVDIIGVDESKCVSIAKIH